MLRRAWVASGLATAATASALMLTSPAMAQSGAVTPAHNPAVSTAQGKIGNLSAYDDHHRRHRYRHHHRYGHHRYGRGEYGRHGGEYGRHGGEYGRHGGEYGHGGEFGHG